MIPVHRRRSAAILTAFAAAALSPDVASAQPPPAPAPKVILLRPAAVPAAVSEALVRLQAELTVEGFDAQVTEVDLGTDVRASLERMAPTMAATAVSRSSRATIRPAPSCGSSIA